LEGGKVERLEWKVGFDDNDDGGATKCMVGTEVGEKDGTAVADDENKEGFNEDDIDGNSEEILLG